MVKRRVGMDARTLVIYQPPHGLFRVRPETLHERHGPRHAVKVLQRRVKNIARSETVIVGDGIPAALEMQFA